MALSQSFRNTLAATLIQDFKFLKRQLSLGDTIYFPNYGKGILLYNTSRKSEFFIEILQEESESSILLGVESERAFFRAKIRGETKELVTVDKSSIGEKVGYDDSDNKVTYWWSYDSDAMTIKYGKGYYMKETTLMSYTFNDQEGNENRSTYFDPTKPKTVKIHNDYPWKTTGPPLLSGFAAVVNFAPVVADLEQEIVFSLHPLTCNRPPIVRDSSSSNLFDIDLGKYTYSSSLPDECKVLYANVTGVNMRLDYGEQAYKLTDAIRHSIESKDGILYKRLEEKKGEFGPDDQVYLRVTVGKTFGNSPGTPYVLEIWPKKCGSPVHNHGNSCAVIRVLHGGLKIFIYNKQLRNASSAPYPLTSFDVRKDDVTWISPNWYQTHRLFNDTNDFCATIQCYQYGDTDDIHWPYFDYINPETGHTDNFVPDSDFHFTDMYNRVMKEYEDYMKSTHVKRRARNKRKGKK